jgi:hypothetical protein
VTLAQKKGGELAAASGALALVAQLVVQHVGLHLHSLVDLAVLELDEPSANGGDVALLVREGDSAGALGVLQLGIGVDASVADAAVQPVHDHGKFDGLQWPGDAADEDGLPRIQRERGIKHEVGVRQSPRPNLHRLVLDGGRRDAQVELILVLNARVDQRLHGCFLLQKRATGQHSFPFGPRIYIFFSLTWHKAKRDKEDARVTLTVTRFRT